MNLWIFFHGYICKKGLNFGQRQKQYVTVSTEKQKGKNKGNLHLPAGQRSHLGTEGTRETSTRRQGSIHSWGLSSGFVAAAGGVSAEQQ